jgi:hypothetical protein
MLDFVTTVLICNSGKDLSCLNKNFNLFPSSRVVTVCKKRGECEQIYLKTGK